MAVSVVRPVSVRRPNVSGRSSSPEVGRGAVWSEGSASIGVHLRNGVPVTDLAPAPPDAADVAPAVAELETIVSLSKRRGFIFPSSEIYGGINAVWDYGPLGVEL